MRHTLILEPCPLVVTLKVSGQRPRASHRRSNLGAGACDRAGKPVRRFNVAKLHLGAGPPDAAEGLGLGIGNAPGRDTRTTLPPPETGLYLSLYLALYDTHSYPCTGECVLELPEHLFRRLSCRYLLERE